MKPHPLLLFLIIVWPLLLQAQDIPEEGALIDTIDTRVDLFNDPDPMDITLTLNLKEYQRNKFKGEYMPVHLLYHINDSIILEKTMRIKARGKFRREYCTFAPFWLNIRKADVKNQYLQDVKRMKIVTHCRSAKGYQEYLLKEYLTYKIYNILSPFSFRVRLIRMKYVDTGRKSKVTEGWAFMIEPEEMLAERHNALSIKNDKLSMSFMEPESMDLMALFMFMVGNADYSIAGRHNVKILGLPGFGANGYTPVPYDFDYSGLVNATYAVPGEALGIESVRERYYLGLCREEAEFQLAIRQIQKHREEILQLISSFHYLDAKQKSEMIAYLEEYFDLASSPGQTKLILKTCR